MSSLRFLHIPKTAGSTFSRILYQQYTGKSHFDFTGDIASDLKRFETLSAEDRKDIAFFSGHAPITTGIVEADQTIITFLRNPISRVKSFCQHVYEGKSPYLLEDFPPETFSLDDFLNSGIGELSNLQTKMLINHGISDTSELIDRLSISEAIHRAVSNLSEKITCFGIQEYFDESLILFAVRFNWQNLHYDSVNKKNASRKLQFTDKNINQIVELNAADIAVYKFARENFLLQVNSKKFDTSRFYKLRLSKFWRDLQAKFDKNQAQ
jgi:hypothetical protein